MSDSSTYTMLECLGALGYSVVVMPNRLLAVDQDTGERFVVTFDDRCRHRAACELVRMVEMYWSDR